MGRIVFMVDLKIPLEIDMVCLLTLPGTMVVLLKPTATVVKQRYKNTTLYLLSYIYKYFLVTRNTIE